MPQTRKEKRAGAIRRLERYIVDCQRALQHGGSDEEIQAQTKRKEHLEYLLITGDLLRRKGVK